MHHAIFLCLPIIPTIHPTRNIFRAQQCNWLNYNIDVSLDIECDLKRKRGGRVSDGEEAWIVNTNLFNRSSEKKNKRKCSIRRQCHGMHSSECEGKSRTNQIEICETQMNSPLFSVREANTTSKSRRN